MSRMMEREPGTLFRCLGKGRFGADALADGTVLAVFERSFYIASDRGALACLGAAGLGAGPLNVLYDLPAGLDWTASRLRPNDPVRRADDEIDIGRFRFATDGPLWRPPDHRTDWRRDLLPGGLDVLAHASSGLAPAEGFASLVPLLASHDPICRGRACPARTAEPAAPKRAGHARPLQIEFSRSPEPILAAIGALGEWLKRDGELGANHPAAMLIGLGPGLTPSGDDLLGGAMIALHALGEIERARHLGEWALPLAATRTNRISLAHLRCAAEGEGAEPLHLVLDALGRPDAPGLDEALRRVAAIGHSSGWDALAGATLACSVLSAR